MCVASLYGEAPLSSSVYQAIALALVAPPVPVTDLGRHGLASLSWYCGSVYADLVLWICAFVFCLFLDGTILIFPDVLCLDYSVVFCRLPGAYVRLTYAVPALYSLS